MTTFADTTAPHAVFDARALRDAWRISRTVDNPRAYVGAHLDCADLDPQGAPWHELFAAIYSHAADIHTRQQHVAGEPVQGPQPGVPCSFCDRVDCWATYRVVWTSLHDTGDVEVGAACVDPAMRWIESTTLEWRSTYVEPMTASDYARHGILVADGGAS